MTCFMAERNIGRIALIKNRKEKRRIKDLGKIDINEEEIIGKIDEFGISNSNYYYSLHLIWMKCLYISTFICIFILKYKIKDQL